MAVWVQCFRRSGIIPSVSIQNAPQGFNQPLKQIIAETEDKIDKRMSRVISLFVKNGYTIISESSCNNGDYVSVFLNKG